VSAGRADGQTVSAGPAGADAVSARTLWRAAIVGGAGLLVVGVVLIAWPHQTVLVVAVVLGLWMLTQGAFAVVGRLMHPPRYPRGAGTVGILGMVAGLFLVGQPARSLHAGAIVLGSVLVCLGVIELVAGLVAWTRDRRHRADGSVAVTA